MIPHHEGVILDGDTEYESEHEWDRVNSDMDGSMLYGDYRDSENKNLEVFEELKEFEELNREQIDEVAANIRKISPKFADLKRPMAGTSETGIEEKEYEEEVKRIALLPENFSTVMTTREEEKPILSTRPNSPTTPSKSLSRRLNETQYSNNSRET